MCFYFSFYVFHVVAQCKIRRSSMINNTASLESDIADELPCAIK